MELVINFSLRKAPGQRALPVNDLIIRDLFAKMPGEVREEIEREMSRIIGEAYVELGEYDSLEDLDE